jgi:hypothetical protein
MKKIITILLLTLSIAFVACIDENPNLVNPPSNVDKIYVRFVNLSGDFNSYYFTFNGANPTPTISFATTTDAMHPPLDSAIIAAQSNGSIVFQFKRQIKFTRDINYSYIAIPSAQGDSIQKNVDTLIALTTSMSMPSYSTDAYISLMNAVPDSTYFFSLTMGCPNANPLISGINYRHVSQPSFISTGDVPISILQTHNGVTTVLGTYKVPIVSRGQYVAIVMKDKDGQIKLYILDELNLQNNAFFPAEIITSKQSFIRTINLSSDNISIIKDPSEVIAANLASNSISNYQQTSACTSNVLDSLIIQSNNTYSTSYKYSFNVLSNYSLIVADSAGYKANNLVVVPPSPISNLNGQTSLRFVNLAWSLKVLDVAMSSRQNDSSASGYTAGISLAKQLPYGQISNLSILPAGEIPLSVFTSFVPYQLLSNTFINTQPNKDYVIVITNDAQGNLILSIVESSEQNSNINFLQSSSFVQVINAIARTGNINISIGNYFQNAQLYYGNTIATNIPFQNNTISYSYGNVSNTIPISPQPNNRYTVILCGDKDSPDYIILENPISVQNPNLADIRFVNCSNDFSSISVTDNITNNYVIAELNYKVTTSFYDLDKSKRYTYYFLNTANMKQINSFDFDITFGKRYTILFAGTNKNNFGYNIIMVQEY